MLITYPQARDQVRVESDYPTTQLDPYIEAAEDAVQRYLNRAVYADQASLDAARDGYVAAMVAAQTAYDAAVDLADAMTDETEQEATLELAVLRRDDAVRAAAQAIHGVVVNPSIIAAILLILGHLFANRENVVVGATVEEMSLNARDLLRPYRRVMMP